MRKTILSAGRGIAVTALFFLFLSGAAFASHPLITDDPGTQGTGKYQLEVNGEYNNASGDTDTKLTAILSAGVRENIDIVLTAPYHFLSEKEESGSRIRHNGLSDITLEAKWRFYEKEGTSLALKPGVSLPTGDEAKGLGDGRPGYSVFFIAEKEKEPFTLLINLGYIRNRLELRDILHASFAAEYAATKRLTVVGNIGIETNPDRDSNISPAFLIGGVVYNLYENFDLDCGIKTGLTRAEADYGLLAGLAYRF
jgi:Putative MetA-pathway of phenol degradation